MAPPTVVEDLDVLEDRGPGVIVTDVVGTMDQLGLERREETLGNSVVPAIALATHAADDAAFAKLVLVVRARVLHAAVRMVEQARLRAASLQGHVQGIEGQGAVDAR